MEVACVRITEAGRLVPEAVMTGVIAAVAGMIAAWPVIKG